MQRKGDENQSNQAEHAGNRVEESLDSRVARKLVEFKTQRTANKKGVLVVVELQVHSEGWRVYRPGPPPTAQGSLSACASPTNF